MFPWFSHRPSHESTQTRFESHNWPRRHTLDLPRSYRCYAVTRWFASSPHPLGALIAEALALKSGLLAAQVSNITQVACYSCSPDYQILTRLLQSGGHSNKLHGILEDIRSICPSFSEVCFIYIPRTKNSSVDASSQIISRICTSSSNGVWVSLI